MSNARARTSSSLPEKKAHSPSSQSAFPPHRNQVALLEPHDISSGAFDALSTAVQGAAELLKHRSHPASDVTSPGGVTDDGERRLPHSAPKRAVFSTSTSIKDVRTHKYDLESSWDLIDTYDVTSTADIETFEANEDVTDNGSPTPAAVTVVTHPIAPTSSTHRTRRRPVKSCHAVMEDVVLPKCGSVEHCSTGITTSSTQDTVSAHREDDRPFGDDAHVTVQTAGQRAPLHHASACRTEALPAVTRSATDSPASSPSSCTKAGCAGSHGRLAGAQQGLPPLCVCSEENSPDAKRVPHSLSPRRSSTASPLAHNSDAALMRLYSQTHLSAGQDDIAGLIQLSWISRRRSELSPGASLRDASFSSPQYPFNNSHHNNNGSAQRFGPRWSASEQPSIASDTTFVDHGEIGAFTSSRMAASGSISTSSPAVNMMRGSLQWGETGTVRASVTQLNGGDAVCASPLKRTSRVPPAPQPPGDSPRRSLQLTAPDQRKATTRARVPAKGDRDDAPLSSHRVDRSDTVLSEATTASREDDEESDADIPAASTMTARPTHRKPGPTSSNGAGTMSSNSARCGEAASPASGSPRNSRRTHEPATAMITDSTRSEKLKKKPAYAGRGTSGLTQYQEAVKYAHDRDCGLTLKELLAKGCANMSGDEEDD